jgi:thiamine-monophosphate kinase
VAGIDAMYAGMTELANRFGVAIVGGDTVECSRGYVISVALIGKVEEERYVSRHGARPGDVVCVTGTLGGSLLGKHLAFTPRVPEGRFLATNFSPTAMIDISDGLASDLMKMMEASRTTAEVLAESIPVSEAAKRSAKRKGISALEAALHDGEDFELLFTLSKEEAEKCLALFRDKFSTPISVIGRVKRGRSRPLLVMKDGALAPLEAGGYEHFRASRRPPKGDCQG